jgi:hypothetical protein
LQISRGRDRQRFVWTYTPAPALTAYVKSDPNAGTLVLMTGEDGVDVYIDNVLYRRKTERGQLRIPIKVGSYKVRVHKAGFTDPNSITVEVKKSEETALAFKLQPAHDVQTTLAGQSPLGTPATPPGPDKPAENTTQPSAPEPSNPKPIAPVASAGDAGPEGASDNPVLPGAQVRKGGGFVSYHVPKAAGNYTFQAQGRVGGFIKHSKVQWYAGYQDSENYILFSLDGKHANVREVRQGKSIEWNRVPFSVDSNQPVDVSLSVKPDSVGARVKGPDGNWSDLGSVTSPGRDFTQDRVGFYIPSSDEVAVSNFRFSRH